MSYEECGAEWADCPRCDVLKEQLDLLEQTVGKLQELDRSREENRRLWRQCVALLEEYNGLLKQRNEVLEAKVRQLERGQP
jgi:hypothetical protein